MLAAAGSGDAEEYQLVFTRDPDGRERPETLVIPSFIFAAN